MAEAYCPYCDEENYLDLGYDETFGSSECEHCNKTFSFTAEVEISVETHRAACLNGGNHSFSKSSENWCLDCNKYIYPGSIEKKKKETEEVVSFDGNTLFGEEECLRDGQT